MSLAALTSAVEDLADTMMGIDCGSTFEGMTCPEVESLAVVFAVAGRLDAAAHVVMMHGDADEEDDDQHHDIYEALREPEAGFSHDVADKPFRLAMEYARELA